MINNILYTTIEVNDRVSDNTVSDATRMWEYITRVFLLSILGKFSSSKFSYGRVVEL